MLGEMRLVLLASLVVFAGALIACGSGQAATTSPTVAGVTGSPTATGTFVPARAIQAVTPAPTVSPTPVPINHAAPYKVALEAGHGGPNYLGASAYDSEGNQWIEKDLTLDLSMRVGVLLTAMGYDVLQIRTDDSTLTDFAWFDYHGSLIREAQARIDVANAASADAYVAIHFNGWSDGSLSGTESYCNPDRSFGEASCQLATDLKDAVLSHVRADGYELADRGLRNDADVQGPAEIAHSWVLGTNPDFRPALMPGAIIESMFLSNPSDLDYLRRPEALDVIAAGIAEGIDNYFRWLNPPQ
jgi:N-acetylmuramoyl-L-alanine amidase